MNAGNHTQIIEMSANKARLFFLKPERYVNFSLPRYITFEEILKVAGEITKGKKQVSDICRIEEGHPVYPSRYLDVNYTVLSNKDGGFAWRPFQIIHPVLYIEMVNFITQDNNWKKIQNFFKERNKTKIKCMSIPLESNTTESDRAEQVNNWWDKVEQETLRLSLDYSFMYQTDISDCYGSIYTHSFEWALADGGRLKIKEDRKETGKSPSNLGTEIDKRLQNMNAQQTNGIPQGSTLMDFLAEIVLGGVDIELNDRIRDDKILSNAEFTIIRYRDDYRVLSTESHIGHKIIKLLSDVLMNWNFKMNSSKTFRTDDLISSSIKQEKLEEIYEAPVRLSYQKEAMRIFLLSRKYPGSGLVVKQLVKYHNRIARCKRLKNIDYEVIISIITMIAYHNPKYIAQVAAIVTKLIERSNGEIDRDDCIDRIIKKLSNVPNAEFVDIWLQRIMDGDSATEHKFNSRIAKVVAGKKETGELWNSAWLTKQNQDKLNVEISTLKKAIDTGEFNPVMEDGEFQLYNY